MLITRLIVLAAIAFAGHASAAGVLNDYLNFTGPLPSGWTAYLHPQASGTGFEYTSGKFEVNAYNTGAFLEKSFDPDNRLEFIDVTYSTLATQSTFLPYENSRRQLPIKVDGDELRGNYAST